MISDLQLFLIASVIVNSILVGNQHPPEIHPFHRSLDFQSVSYAGGHRKIFFQSIRVKNREELKFLTRERSGDHPVATLVSDPGEGFEPPVHFESGGEDFLYVSTIPVGSGAFVNETIYWIAPDGTFHQIPFFDAGRRFEGELDAGETLLTGGPGIIFTDQGLNFEYSIARNGDPHCCPTGGIITGFYELIGEKQFDRSTGKYDCTFQIIPDSFVRRD